MKKGVARPDAFSVAMFAAGVIMTFLPLLRMAGIVAVLAAAAYYLTMTIIRLIKSARRRSKT